MPHLYSFKLIYSHIKIRKEAVQGTTTKETQLDYPNIMQTQNETIEFNIGIDTTQHFWADHF